MSMAWSSTLCPAAESAPTARKTLPQPHGQGAERHRRVTRDSVGLDGLVLEPNAIDARLDNHKVSLKFATSVAIFRSMSDQASRLFCSKGRRMTARSAASRRPRSCSRHHTSILSCL